MKKHITLITLLLFVPGCAEEPVLEEKSPRAVSFVVLRRTPSSAGRRLTGTVESWKREELGFQVAGRLVNIVEPGIDIEGRTLDEEGNLLTEGTVLARIDPERYEIARKQAETAAEAARTDLEEVVPQMLAEAEAALALANKELQRYQNLVSTQSASRQQLDIAETAQKAAEAKVAQVEALRATKAATLNTALATVEQAVVNITDCELRSPFTGQIARVHIIPGGYALPGQPVVTVQMMDPMKVQIAVSPEVDKQINFNDRVRVYLPDSNEAVQGYVYLKDTYADPATRTYLITLLVRNRKTTSGIPEELQGTDVATTQKLWTLLPETPGSSESYFIEVNAIQSDEDGAFVWKVENLTAEQLYESFEPVLKVRKVRVKLGDRRLPALQVFTFREVTDWGELDPETDVILGEVEGEVENGQVVMTRERWMLRPGDLAEVSLQDGGRPEGFYVPRVAILNDGAAHYVYVVAADTATARRVEVRPLEIAGQEQRIEAVARSLQPGDRIIVGGAHYVMDDEDVSLVEELEMRP